MDSYAMQEDGVVPPLRRRSLLAIQATHFPDCRETMIVASIDHVVADMQSFMDFLSAWCNECAAASKEAAKKLPAGSGAASEQMSEGAAWKLPAGCAPKEGLDVTPRTCSVAMPPPPVWDRSLLLAVPPAATEDWPSSTAGSSAEGGSGGASDDGLAHSSSASSLSSLGSAASGGSAGSGRSGRSLVSMMGLTRTRSFWEGPPVYEQDPLCRVSGISMVARLLLTLGGCHSPTWLLQRGAIDAMKQRLRGAMPAGAAPTANDVVSAMLVAGVAWLDPGRVRRRGGMNLNVVVNARGRFGLDCGRDYFGTNSLLVPVWVPAELLLGSCTAETPASATPGDPAGPWAPGPGPLPSPELVAFIHAGLRAALGPPDPGGCLVRRRYEWMAGAQSAGVAGRMRACEAAGLLEGDVCVDNVSNYPLFDLRFGGGKVASAAALRFVSSPRLAWVSAAGPGSDRVKGGPSGDLLVTVPLPAKDWARLAPWWEAAGLSMARDAPTPAAAASHPAAIRYTLSEVTRTALGGF